jgi:hypothetical protein
MIPSLRAVLVRKTPAGSIDILSRADGAFESKGPGAIRGLSCQIASNSDPPFACKDDPASVRECFASDGAETGGAEPHIAEQSRSWRASSSEREVMRGS